MNKSDIKLEIASICKELRYYVPKLEPISPALARLFAQMADETEQGKFDAYGITLRRGKANGMVLAAQTIVGELEQHGLL
jgi:hypothetical protein